MEPQTTPLFETDLRPAWHAPEIGTVELKRTLFMGGSVTDGSSGSFHSPT